MYSLVGAFDVAAEVVDHILGLGTKRPFGWQGNWHKQEESDWHKKLLALAPMLHAYTNTGGETQTLFAVLRWLGKARRVIEVRGKLSAPLGQLDSVSGSGCGPRNNGGVSTTSHPVRRTVLVVDDDARIRMVAAWQLEAEGFVVAEAEDGEAALTAVARSAPDLVVLDVNLPRLNGLDVLARLRRVSDIPVILLTGRAGETDRIVGLDLGADDYVMKPFSPAELAARARSVLRRTAATRPPDARLVFGRLMVDRGTREATVDGERIELTAREFDLLAFLAASPRQVFSREQLLERVWESSSDWQVDATVTQHVHRLRHKLGIARGEPGWVSTVRGAGYRFEP